ncbi:MAG: hypothetical protein ABI670_09690 [Chloroflexota bacterium]
MQKYKYYLAAVLLILLSALLVACGDAPAPAATAVPPAQTAAPADQPTVAAEIVDNATPTTEAPAEAVATVEPTHQRGDADTADEPTPAGDTAGDTADVTPEAAGMVADLGFRPETNGFAFENYGGDGGRVNLAPADVRRMFGDVACGSLAGGDCILTPPAERWMNQANESMSGGHCEGFASLSLVFYTEKEKSDQFGAPRTVDLQLDGNEALQREIAYYFATQYTAPTAANEIKGTPNEMLDLLIASFKDGAPGETYTMGIYQRGFKGGHAITPFAVEMKEDGRYAVLVYDNNYPGVTRTVTIDRNANTWNYEASINPNEPASEYEGDATTGTLSLTPTSPRLVKQVCAFCEDAGGYAPGAKQLAPTQEYNQVWLEGDGKVLLVDKDGHRMGIVDGVLVNEIPGAYFTTPRSGDLWKDTEPPTFYVPTGIEFTVTLDGTGLTAISSSSVTMIGPGYDLAVDDIELDPGQKDSINFASDGKTVKYTTDYNESPSIYLGIEGKEADYAFEAKGVDIESGGTMTLGIDTTKGRLSINTVGNKEAGAYALLMDRIYDDGEQTFGHDNIELEPNSSAFLDYETWKGDGSEISLSIDTGNDGTVDETISLTDE